jgi:hypothetical protein
VIEYQAKVITVEVMVYDQNGGYLSNTSIKITGGGFTEIVTPELLGKINRLALGNVGK